MDKRAVLLVNVGTPSDCKTSSVKRYLTQFLTDKYVITLPWLVRQILVRAIIVPFRSEKSASLYKKIWRPEGSPLLVNSEQCAEKVQECLSDRADVYHAMRYGEPSLQTVIKKIDKMGYKELILFPMYPQYAISTTGSVFSFIQKHIAKSNPGYKLKSIYNFYRDKGFINAFAAKIREHNFTSYDRILFSFHGLPLSHVEKTHKGKSCEDLSCIKGVTKENESCYHATCYETARLIATELHLTKTQYSVAFQSRFGKRWLSPFTEDTLIKLAEDGVKRVLVVTPSFVADCLETLSEIKVEYKELFISKGGEELTLVDSLNNSSDWIDYLREKIERAFT